MARARNIKPGFFRNADLVELSMEARLLFIGLWVLADREGRLEDRPKQIKMEIFPADSVDCNALLNDLAATSMVVRYEVDGKRYLQVANFAKHQNPHRDEKTSTIPDQFGNITGKVAAVTKHGVCTVQAQCLPDAQTMPTPFEPDAGTVPIGLNPDPRSLIADSLIPDSLTKDALPTQTPDVPDGPARTVSVAGSICMAMKAVGMASVNPNSPDLKVLIDAGADIGLFVEVARAAVKKGKGFAYTLAAVKGQMADAAALADSALAVPHKQAGNGAPAESFAERDARAKREAWERETGRQWPVNELPASARPAAPLTILIDENSTRRIA